MANLELDRKVAEAAGWTHIAEDSWWEETFYDTSEVHGLSGTAPFASDRRPVPFFSTDLHAAWELLVGRGLEVPHYVDYQLQTLLSRQPHEVATILCELFLKFTSDKSNYKT